MTRDKSEWWRWMEGPALLQGPQDGSRGLWGHLSTTGYVSSWFFSTLLSILSLASSFFTIRLLLSIAAPYSLSQSPFPFFFPPSHFCTCLLHLSLTHVSSCPIWPLVSCDLLQPLDHQDATLQYNDKTLEHIGTTLGYDSMSLAWPLRVRSRVMPSYPRVLLKRLACLVCYDLLELILLSIIRVSSLSLYPPAAGCHQISGNRPPFTPPWTYLKVIAHVHSP